jgi:hypothetical protein
MYIEIGVKHSLVFFMIFIETISFSFVTPGRILSFER